jgi:hypothetical protein
MLHQLQARESMESPENCSSMPVLVLNSVKGMIKPAGWTMYAALSLQMLPGYRKG